MNQRDAFRIFQEELVPRVLGTLKRTLEEVFTSDIAVAEGLVSVCSSLFLTALRYAQHLRPDLDIDAVLDQVESAAYEMQGRTGTIHWPPTTPKKEIVH
jgi:hypothetical protein